MKAISKMSLTVMVPLVLLGCSSKGTEEKRNREAIMLHNSMIKKANQIEYRLNEMRSDSTVNKDSISILSEALEQWKLDLVEVPGNEELDHLGHDHEHKNKVPEVTQEQMLEIQKELDRRLGMIAKRLENLNQNGRVEEKVQ